MSTLKKFILFGLFFTVTVGATNIQAYSFLDKLYWSHYMSKLSEYKQQAGFLLSDLQYQAQTITHVAKNHDAKAFTKLDKQELAYHMQHCFDLELNHAQNRDKLTDELIGLVNAFNELVQPITADNIAALTGTQIDAIQKSCDALVNFAKRYGIGSANTREIIKDLQKEAKTKNKPVQSVLRKEYVIPAVVITAAIASIFLWNKWLSQKFWEWWNKAPIIPPILNKDVKIGNATCKGEEHILPNKARIVQTSVVRQSGLSCGQHALLNATTILGSINSTDLYAQLNDQTATTAKITAMKDYLKTQANGQIDATHLNIMGKLNNPNTLQDGDLTPLAEFLIRINKLARGQEFNTISERLNLLALYDPLPDLVAIRNNLPQNQQDINQDAIRKEIVARLQIFAGFDPLIDQLINEAQQLIVTRDILDNPEPGPDTFYKRVNNALIQYRAQQRLTMRAILVESLQQVTPQEKDRYANQQGARNNNINPAAEFIGSGAIEALIQEQSLPYRHYMPANKNAGAHRTISVIDSPDQYVPTPAQLQEYVRFLSTNPTPQQLQQYAATHPNTPGIDLFANIRRNLANPGEYMHAFVLGNMRQTGDTVGSQGGFAHWITLVLHKTADGTHHYIIADSINGRQLESNNIKKVIAAIED